MNAIVPVPGAAPSGCPFTVFLSHSTRDAEHVALVQRQLEALGIRVWLAEHDLRPGTSVLAKIESVLPTCDAVVVLITSNGVDSAYVHQEVGMARTHGKPLVPLVDRHVEKQRLGLVGELEWIEIDLDDPSDAFVKVTQSLHRLVLLQVAATARKGSGYSIDVTDPAVAILLIGLGVALGLLICSYSVKVEIGPSA